MKNSVKTWILALLSVPLAASSVLAQTTQITQKEQELLLLEATPVGALPPIALPMPASRNHNYWGIRLQVGNREAASESHLPAFAAGLDLQYRAGEALSKAGFKFFYHTHGYEFVPFQNGTLMDLLMAETNPKYVHFQMDVYWVVNPGHDPVKLFQKYGNRFELMHVKDMKQGTPLSLTGHSEVTNNVALGKGVIDWPSVMRAAKAAGVKWYFLEDESPSALTQIPESIQYLKTLKL
jgi:sugar phosphate isomerase/epimerase